MPAENSLEHGAVIELEVVLFEHTHTFARALSDSSGGRRELAAEHTHKGGFTGSVGTDDAIAVAGRELEVYVLEQRFFTELNT